MKSPKIKNIAAIGAAVLLSASLIAADILKKGEGEAREDASLPLDEEASVSSNGIKVTHIGTVKNSSNQVTKTFTYSITPENASKEVSLSLYWQDTTCTEDLSSYMSGTLDAEKQTVTLVCVKSFAYVIEAKLTSAIDSSIYATIELHYVQRFSGFRENCENRAEGEVVREELLSAVETIKDQDEFIASQKDQSTARFYPKFGTRFTKPYPNGTQATYTVQYVGIIPWVKSEFVSDEMKARFQAVIDELESKDSTIWQTNDPSVPLKGIDEIYKALPYADQRTLNRGGEVGVRRVYACTCYLDEDNSTSYYVHWVLKATTAELSNYLANVSITPDATSIDF